MPIGSKLIENPLTVAPGFNIENVYVFPGVPRIMQKMFIETLKTQKTSNPIISETINTNLYESIIAETLSKIQEKYNNCEIGSYPSFDFKNRRANVNIVVSGTDKISIKLVVKEIIFFIKKLRGRVQK